MSALQKLSHQLDICVGKRDYGGAAQVLAQLKVELLHHNALMPSPVVAPDVLAQARKILEIGAIVSIHLDDDAAFLRYYAQLQPFYSDLDLASAPARPKPSKTRNKIVGLFLLLLLTRNDIAQFHTTLENMPGAEEDGFVRYPVMLERWLMEGSYDKVWQATKSSQVPSEEYVKFSDVPPSLPLSLSSLRGRTLTGWWTDPDPRHPHRDWQVLRAGLCIAAGVEREAAAIPGVRGRRGRIRAAGTAGACPPFLPPLLLLTVGV